VIDSEDVKQRILFILPSLGRGGAEMQVVGLVNGLDSTQFEKHLLCFENDVSLLENLDQESVVFHHIQRSRFFDFRAIKKIAALIDELDVDLVHCSLQIALFMGWMAVNQSKQKPPLIVALHTTINRNLKADLFDWFVYQWMMRSCKKVICVCETQRLHWQKKFPFLNRLTEVVFNGVDIEHFSPLAITEHANQLRSELKISDDVQIVCHIAGFRPEKGHLILLDAFEQLVKKQQKVMLIFAGDGALRSLVEETAEAKGLLANVHFLGAVPDVRPVLALSDLAVIASTAVETFSIAMLESMAMEVPLLATDVGGTREAVIKGKTGFLVPENDKQALEDGLLEALNNPQKLKQMGQNARQFVVEKFTYQEMVLKTNELLINVIRDNQSDVLK